MNLRETFNLPLNSWLAVLIAFINSASFTITLSVIYPLAKELGLSDFEASLLNTTYAICQFIAIPILGKLSDYFGEHPTVNYLFIWFSNC